jgi:hypothetical protein
MSTTQLLHTAAALIPSVTLTPCWRCNNRTTATATATIFQTQRREWVHASRIMRIKCMANPRRVKMVAKQIRRELSDMLITDNVLQFAVLPEASLGADSYLSSVTTITDVEITADLQVLICFPILSFSPPNL